MKANSYSICDNFVEIEIQNGNNNLKWRPIQIMKSFIFDSNIDIKHNNIVAFNYRRIFC